MIANDQGEFDLEAWLTRSRPSFPDSVRAAMESLALGRGDLRDRLPGALACLFYTDGRDVPGSLLPAYEAIREEVQRHAGVSIDGVRLRAWLARSKMTTAERIAREIVKLDRRLADRDA